jgi:hypothetical protein
MFVAGAEDAADLNSGLELAEGPADFRDKGGAVSWPVAQGYHLHISLDIMNVVARSQREKAKLSSREPFPRRGACRQQAPHAKFVTAD